MTDAEKVKVLEEAMRNLLTYAQAGENLTTRQDEVGLNYRFKAIANIALVALDRIKPEPVECWAVVYENGVRSPLLYESEAAALSQLWRNPGSRVIRMREV